MAQHIVMDKSESVALSTCCYYFGAKTCKWHMSVRKRISLANKRNFKNSGFLVRFFGSIAPSQ